MAKHTGFKKNSSFFYNQTSFIIDRKTKNETTLNESVFLKDNALG
jgi:hypothetical protein